MTVTRVPVTCIAVEQASLLHAQLSLPLVFDGHRYLISRTWPRRNSPRPRRRANHFWPRRRAPRAVAPCWIVTLHRLAGRAR